ncbi:MAM and LDL-receptor class A domain-containing protein 1-like isoform X2 [Ptychodera flava]|uniref:MAM and LDL-receptor class A domain-containing protein 1-like isoform X2 n=1 Tax=Ptychodera flava TaxID=63121 RepID=UPI00396A1BC3
MTDTDAWQKNNPRESVYSISGGTSKRTADSTDPIYQYSTVQGKTKTRKFAHPKTARAIDGPAGDDRKFSKSTSRTRVILLSACALVLLSVCVAIAVAIGGIGKRQSVQHVDGNERNLSHHQPSSNDVTSTPSLQEIHIITSERFQRQPESTPNVVTALNDRTTTLDTTPEVPPQTAKLTDSGHLHEDVVSSASPYEDGNQHVSNMVTEVASKRNSQSVENTVTVNIPLTQKPSAASRQNRLTDITTVYSGSDDIMSKPLAASQSSETASDLKLDKTLGQPNYSNLPNTEAPTPTSAEISTLPPFEPNSRSYQLDVTQAGIKKANELNNLQDTLPFYCDFQNTTLCGFTQDYLDDFDWSRNSGGTSSSNTGPSYDHTQNDLTGYYMYIETSNYNLGDTARLISPEFLIENHLCLRFWYHMYGADIGEFNVYQKRSSYLGNAIWSKGLAMGNVWLYANVTLANSGIAMAYQVVFEGVHGGSYQGDIAIDDVLIQDGSCDDIYTSAGIEPFPTNLTVDYASQVELICRVRGVGHPQMDIVSWTRISGDTVVVAVRGLNVLDTGDDPEEPGEQNRYSVAWNASSQYYTLRIHSVRNIDEAEWLCRFDTVDLEESVWLQVRDPVCQWQCLNGGVCRHTWNGSSICFCPWPYSGDDCSIGTTGSLDVLCDFGDALICGVTYEADDYTEFVWANILNFDFSPIVDHTYGNASAYFGVVHTVYAYRYHSMTRLFTPVYTASSSSSNIVCLEFWYNTVYHLSGTHVDVFLRQSGVANDTIINSFDVDYLETGWRQSSVPITIEAQFFQMIIELSFAYREMILIDDLIVHDGTCKDIDECSAGEFYCEDNTTCVSADYACDRNMNCPDRSDERGCGDCGGEFNVPAGGSRKIQSPGSTYGLYNINCSWLITTDDDFSFKVVFDQWSDTIQYGSMDIGSGSQVSNHGRQLRFRDRILGEPEFLVNSNELWLHLRIDFLYSYNVWQIMLLSQPESPLPLPGELCTFEDVYICGFIRGNSGEMWARQRGQVSQRQPWYDHTSQNGYYMYVDGDYYYGTGVRLTSITQPPSRESCLEFWYYMSSSSDHLRVFINGGGNNDTLIVRLTGNIEPFWRYARIAYSMDEPHQVIFEGESYYWSSNIASTMFGCRTRLVMYHIVAATSPFKAIPQRFF